MARWLAKGGTGHLLLVSRSGARAAGADELRTELRELGAAVTIAACDAADPDRLRDVIGALPGEQPLTAVVHAAGVLDDGTLDSLTPARTAACLRAKLTAAHALHEATAGHDLAAFVVFSSLMGVVGNAGQAGYTAANAALEAFVAGRRAEGLPGTAIAWGRGPRARACCARTWSAACATGACPPWPRRRPSPRSAGRSPRTTASSSSPTPTGGASPTRRVRAPPPC
ncbi:ketoreductase domain-containing protein [Streptomyces clavuligerus]|uniref:ketoreductase domain-containing protein n=1 Tax=Streptomyces clavuligerus TaxID=1901 RepID=UPI0022AC77BA|nr:ketoreductase domain-containing protein [Streptomyces clavuligerus]